MAERPIAILKTGSTLASLRERGDFEDWFGSGLARDCTVVDVRAGDSLPDPADHAGIVITGSPEMVSHRNDWAEATLPWLREAVAAGIPTLGVCFGHQLLAHALGGLVAPNPHGRQIGTVGLTLTGHEDDPLLGELDLCVHVQTSHLEAVITPPSGSVTLGHTERDAHHVLRFGPAAWGVQFHPEFDAAIVRGYISGRAEAIRGEGADPEALAAACFDTPVGPQLLRRFAVLTDRP